MSAQKPPSILFTLNGRRYELTRDVVESRLADVALEVIRKHAVRVNGTWYPVIQAFEAATGISRLEFISHTARRHLAAVGCEVRGQIESHGSAETQGSQTTGLPPESAVEDAGGEWHTEANVQAAVVGALVADGWRILSVANTATRERGVDIIASRDGSSAGVEVKGFPNRGYADPARSSETKRSSPSTQAGHWYAQAVLAAMRLRGKQPQWRSAIALPDFPRYRDLNAETSGSLSAAGIEVWWVHEDGTVIQP